MFSFLFIQSLVRKSAASGNLFLPKLNLLCIFLQKQGGNDILSTIIHLGNPSRERRSHFTVYFTAGFRSKTVPSTMNELYLTWAMREAAYSQCTMEKYVRSMILLQKMQCYDRTKTFVKRIMLRTGFDICMFEVWSASLFYKVSGSLHFDLLIFVCFVERLTH